MLSSRMPELSALEVFVTVARTGSLNAAAGVLGVSQQAVSARIATIERQTGVVLLQRTPRGSSLTPAGVVVSEWAARLLVLADEMDAGLLALRGDAQRTLRVAASLTIAEYLLPGWLVALQTSRAGKRGGPVAVELTVVNSSGVVALVNTGEADLGFVEGASPPRGLRHRTVAYDRLVVVVAPTHPWAKRRQPITASQLAQTPLVVREHGSGTREVLAIAVKKLLGSAVELEAPTLSLPTTAAVRAAVVAGAGPAVLSELAVADDIAAGRLAAVSVEDIDLARSLRAVWTSVPEPPAGPARELVVLASSSPRRA
jgi:DNA-binding transcriptional LysR family regulator